MTYLGNLTYESVLFYYSSDVLRSRSQSSFFPLCFFFFLVLDRIDNVFAALTIHYMVGCKKHCPPCSWYGVYCSGYQKHRSDRLLIYEEMPRLRERPCVRLPYMQYKYVASQSRVKASMERKKGQQIHDLQQITDYEIRFAIAQSAAARIICLSDAQFDPFIFFLLQSRSKQAYICSLLRSVRSLCAPSA